MPKRLPTAESLRCALRAIIARIEGEWDQPDLVRAGPLDVDELVDIKRIAEKALELWE